jgi:hypothetical protein
MAFPHSLPRFRPLIGPACLRCSTAGGCLRVRHTIFRTSPIPAPILHATATRWQSGQPPQPAAAGGANDYQLGPVNDVQPQPSTQHFGQDRPDHEEESDARGGSSGKGVPSRGGGGGGGRGHGGDGTHSRPAGTAWKLFESAATTAASLSILGYGWALLTSRLREANYRDSTLVSQDMVTINTTSTLCCRR